MAENKALKALLKFFNLAIDKTGESNFSQKNNILTPGGYDKQTKEYKPINFPTDIERAIEYFLLNNQIYNTNRDRYELYKSLLFMVRNSGLMLTALQTYITETIDITSGDKPLQIKAVDKKVEKYFYKWLDSIGFNYNLFNELVYDLVLLGDSFLLHDVDFDKGIEKIEILDPFIVKNRIELNVNKAVEFSNWVGTQRNYTTTYQSLQQISDYISGLDENNELNIFDYFKSFTMGYELKFSVDDEQKFKAIPPWYITHFRLFTTKSEFFPFGRPLFINSLAPFQSFKTTEMLIDMLRVASFPKEVINIKGGGGLTPMDRMQRLNDTREFLENISPKTNTKDNIAVGERIYVMDDLFDYRVLDSGVTMDKLGDLEAKLTDLILSTAIPDSLLIPSRGAGGIGGENAQALYFNNKIFQKRVEGIKSAILEGFSNMFRLHLAITEKFDGEKTEFELLMPINPEMYNAEKIQQLSDLFMLADNVVSNLATALGVEVYQIPPDILKEVFRNYMPVDADIIEKWIDIILSHKEEEGIDSNPEGVSFEDSDIVGAGIGSPSMPREPSSTDEGEEPIEASPEEEIPSTEDVEELDAGEEVNNAIIGDDNKVGMIRKRMLHKTIDVPEGESKTAQLKKMYMKKKNPIIENFKRDLANGDDDIIRESYFKAKKDLGMTQGWTGNKICWNDSYNSRLDEALNPYQLVRKEKMFKLDRKLDE